MVLALLELAGHRAERSPLLDSRQQHAILRALGAGERGGDVGEVERQRVGEHRIGRLRRAQHPLLHRIFLDQIDARLLARRVLEEREIV